MNIIRNIFATLLLIGLITASSSAQNRQAASDRAQAVLTIRVNIAPVVVSPQSQAASAHFESISYNIPTSAVRLSVTQHTEEQAAGSNGQQHPVNVVTVVPE
jgi:hypothetical protein